MSNEQKKCPNCGCTEVKIHSLTDIRQFYDLGTTEWSTSEILGSVDYNFEALCTGCETDLLHLVPGQVLAEEPMVRRLLDALDWIVWELVEGCEDKDTILRVAQEALGR